MHSHLDALELNLSNERIRFRSAIGKEKELRAVWVKQLEKEIAGEKEFLGLTDMDEISEDELLAALL